MLGNKTQLVIGRLAGTWSFGCRNDDSASPRSPLDFQIQSPRTRAGLNSYALGGVGLGIVAALEKSGDSACPCKAVFGQNLNRSNPIPVKPALNHCDTSSRYREGLDLEEIDSDDLEDYTFVTCRGPNKSCTRRVVYCDNRLGFDGRSKNSGGFSIFDITPARFGEEITAYPASDFLSCCHLCRKKLHGKDIYMYRGEKGFCSTECRYRQMMMDERKEKCSSESSRSAADGVSNSPYTNGQIFSPGILAI